MLKPTAQAGQRGAHGKFYRVDMSMKGTPKAPKKPRFRRWRFVAGEPSGSTYTLPLLESGFLQMWLGGVCALWKPHAP